MNSEPFPRDALAANRAGELTETQRQHLAIVSRGLGKARRGNLGIILVVAVISVVGAMRALRVGPASAAAFAVIAAIVLLAVTVVVIARLLVAGRAFARDLRRAQVSSVEGAIGKRLGSYAGRTHRRPRFIDVGNEHFQVPMAVYDAAPEAGFVRLYYLPQSRYVVNLERLPDRPLSSTASAEDLVRSVRESAGPDRRRLANELRAQMAGVKQLAESALAPSPVPPPSERDPRPLAQSILGTWSNGLMTITFSGDGSVTATLLNGFERHGRWSVDASGRLHADVMGHEQAASAWVAGDQLVVDAGGQGVTFTRQR